MYLHSAYRNYLHPSEQGMPGPGVLEVIGGVDRLGDAPETAVARVRRIIRHEGYKARSPSDPSLHDIALLELETPLPGPYTRLSLSPETDPPGEVRQLALVAGFGRTVPGDQVFTRFVTSRGGAGYASSEKLLETIVPTSRRRDCNQTDGQICATESGRDSCSGDSGGPLVIFDRDNCPYQIGLTSYGDPKCGSTASPSVYTRLSFYAGWIKKFVPDPSATAANTDRRRADAARRAVWSVVTRLETIAATRPRQRRVVVTLCERRAPGGGEGCRPRGARPLLWGEVFSISAASLSGARTVVLGVASTGDITQRFPVRAQDDEADRVPGRTTVQSAEERAQWELDGGRFIVLSVADDAIDLSQVAAASSLEGKVGATAAYLAQIEAAARRPSTSIGIVKSELIIATTKQ